MVDSFRFLHASDLHLDQPPGGLTEIPNSLVDPLVRATYESVDRVFATALRERVDFVVLCGDVIHFPTASHRALEFLAHQFGRLNEAHIPVYWLGGRLESGQSLPTDFRLPKNVHRFSTSRVQTFEVRRQRKTIAHVVGQSYAEHAPLNLQEMRVPRDGRFFIGVGYHPGTEPLDGDTLDDLGIDYWALGGQHRRQSLEHLIPAEFCGTPQGRLPAEQGPHGCLVLTVTGDNVDDVHFVETALVRYHTERLEVSGDVDSGTLIQRMKSRLQALPHEDKNQRLQLVTWELVHDGRLGKELRRIEHAEVFLDQLRRETESLAKQRGLHSVALRSVRSQIPATMFDEESMLGDFLRAVRDMQARDDAVLDLHSYLPNTPAARQLAETLHLESSAERNELLREVSTLGIDLLGGDPT